jgi:uncharacterized membrane protein
MKNNILQYLWMSILFAFLIGLLIWGIKCVPKVENQIQIFGIVAVVMAAFTSVLTVSINNKKAKEREYDLHVLKEKQKVYEHFYNSLFEGFKDKQKDNRKPSKNTKKELPKKVVEELMLFKQGLMNWGSERLIEKFIDYDNRMASGGETFSLIDDGDRFLKEIRKEMGFKDSSSLSLISIILDSESREGLTNKNQ